MKLKEWFNDKLSELLSLSFKTINFQCSKKYGTPTLVTGLKVVPNMADPIKIKHSVSSLKATVTSKLNEILCLSVIINFNRQFRRNLAMV